MRINVPCCAWRTRISRRMLPCLLMFSGAIVSSPADAQTQPPDGLTSLSLEELLQVDVERVFSASRFVQDVRRAPASVTVITADDIRRFGYRTLADALRSVTGFYTTYDRNYTYLGVRGFGRPGDYNGRILLLIDGHRTNDAVYDQATIGSEFQLDLAILAAALIGASIGFLWYNAFPAEVFMGDTGSMAFGGALAGFAIVTGTEALLILIGGIYVIEALSVMIQTVSFRYWGRRVFLMAPIHHHFEMKAWSETKIMVRFWIIAAILCACGFVLYYRYYIDFRLT